MIRIPMLSQVLRPLFLVALLLALAVVPARAQESAKAFVQKVGDTAIADLTQPDISDSERVKRMRKMLNDVFDVEEVSKFVLGPYVRRATEDEFKEFMKLYEIYVAHNYAALFKKYNGQKIEMQKEQKIGGDEYIVSGLIRQPDGPPVNLQMKVRAAGDTFKAVDLKVEGVSMPLAHRKQFASVINQRGGKISGLMDALRELTETFEKETPSE